jgi:hypothetical protein
MYSGYLFGRRLWACAHGLLLLLPLLLVWLDTGSYTHIENFVTKTAEMFTIVYIRLWCCVIACVQNRFWMSDGMLFISEFSCKWAVQMKPVHTAARVFTWLWVCDTPSVAHELVGQWNACVITHGYYFRELVSHHRQHSYSYCIKWSVFVTVLLHCCNFLHKVNNTWHKGRK